MLMNINRNEQFLLAVYYILIEVTVDAFNFVLRSLAF